LSNPSQTKTNNCWFWERQLAYKKTGNYTWIDKETQEVLEIFTLNEAQIVEYCTNWINQSANFKHEENNITMWAWGFSFSHWDKSVWSNQTSLLLWLQILLWCTVGTWLIILQISWNTKIESNNYWKVNIVHNILI